MATVLQPAPATEPFRWKLFVAVMTIMAAITAAAIMLTLKANPRHDSLHSPSPQPVSRSERLWKCPPPIGNLS